MTESDHPYTYRRYFEINSPDLLRLVMKCEELLGEPGPDGVFNHGSEIWCYYISPDYFTYYNEYNCPNNDVVTFFFKTKEAQAIFTLLLD